ncbi:MAG: hypothetical protein LC107_06810 [Chitinophagales bacterium]|nr:hypothetical protein [Chitinophagales bacterium]
MGKPIKRHPSLVQVSREHHYGLLLSWKIREGLKNNIAPERIKRYTDWFYEKYQKAHFDIEEQFIYPILSSDHPLIVQAIQEHRHIEALFHQEDNLTDMLMALEKAMEAHIRFEERNLFNQIQEVATPEQLQLIEDNHNQPFEDTWEDEFWVRSK